MGLLIPSADVRTFENSLYAAAGRLMYGPPDVRREAVAEVIAAAQAMIEPAAIRYYGDLLGHDHYVIFIEHRWTMEHSLECRLSGKMSDCAYHQAVSDDPRDLGGEDGRAGRWRIAEIDPNGLPVLERAEEEV